MRRLRLSPLIVLTAALLAVPAQARPGLIEALKRPGAYPHKVSRQVGLANTHISWIFLTGQYAYKVKKPLKFSFLDFSDAKKRRRGCEDEVKLNRRLCPNVYLGVVPVKASADGVLSIGGEGQTVDWAVKMKQLPTGRLMSDLLDQGKVGRRSVSSLARIVADFHGTLGPVKGRQHGSTRVIGEQVADLASVRDTIDRATGMGGKVDTILARASAFLRRNRPLFAERRRKGFVRHCHGDLHSGNVFLTRPITVFDCIEFNKSFAYTDTAAEVAFMAMDLDAHGRRDLSRRFVNEYIGRSNDRQLTKLLDFYKCYRANVRAKVAALGYAQKPTEAGRAQIAKYLDLAARYAASLE
jgi:aminoglycoside phosphotransferase family enzyme